MLNDEQIKEQMAGSTAICCLIRDNKLYCANAGDSRAIASRKGALVTLSSDHKPNNPEEMDRIYNAGKFAARVSRMYAKIELIFLSPPQADGLSSIV